MLDKKFELSRPHRVVIYLRMSSERQNPRSPDQQLDVIQELIHRMRLPWEIIAVYRDDGISGRLTRKRPDFQRMTKDLQCGAVQADLILVDTFERLTRADDGNDIRRRFEKMGLQVLTANSGFADPTSLGGKAMAMVESIRASEEGKVKAHNVLRGKKDAVRQGKWPGGPVPLGFRLRPVYHLVKGIEELDYRVLEPDPNTRYVVKRMFWLADIKGWGATKIAKALNNDPRIAAEVKPFCPSTIGKNLDSELYCGDYVWGKNCTGIEDDKRVIQPLPKEDWLRIPKFCKPIISRAQWDRVQAVREARRKPNEPDAIAGADSVANGKKRGLALKYPLTGLVVCGHCGRRMNPQSGAPYTTVSGESRRYVAYGCTGLSGDLCHNRMRIPEEWLRTTVMKLLRQRLHLEVCDPQSPELSEFIEVVQRELASFGESLPDPIEAWSMEKSDLEQRCHGWLQTLGNPSLSSLVRTNVEAEYERTQTRIREIQANCAAHIADKKHRDHVADRQSIFDHLQQLGSVLEGSNCSAMNLMLSHHIDAIICDESGRVTVRTCKLGALSRNLDMFTDQDQVKNERGSGVTAAQYAGTPRRRAQLDIAGAIEDDDEAADANDFAVDTYRFAKLGPKWFDVDHFQVPETLSWSESHAVEVAEFRLSTEAKMEITADHFGVSVPTIRKALRYAKDKHGINALGKKISLATRQNWSRDNARAVASFMKQPKSTMKAAVAFFGKSEPTIRQAIKFAKAKVEDLNSEVA